MRCFEGVYKCIGHKADKQLGADNSVLYAEIGAVCGVNAVESALAGFGHERPNADVLNLPISVNVIGVQIRT